MTNVTTENLLWFLQMVIMIMKSFSVCLDVEQYGRAIEEGGTSALFNLPMESSCHTR